MMLRYKQILQPHASRIHKWRRDEHHGLASFVHPEQTNNLRIARFGKVHRELRNILWHVWTFGNQKIAVDAQQFSTPRIKQRQHLDIRVAKNECLHDRPPIFWPLNSQCGGFDDAFGVVKLRLHCVFQQLRDSHRTLTLLGLDIPHHVAICQPR